MPKPAERAGENGPRTIARVCRLFVQCPLPAGNRFFSMPSTFSAKAGTDYQGDGLAVSPTAEGAGLRCVFQRLEGEATREGLWLTSTVTNAVNERFRVTAAAVDLFVYNGQKGKGSVKERDRHLSAAVLIIIT
jgi:hypothetical protein